MAGFSFIRDLSSHQDYPGMKDISSEAATSHMLKTLSFFHYICFSY